MDQYGNLITDCQITQLSSKSKEPLANKPVRAIPWSVAMSKVIFIISGIIFALIGPIAAIIAIVFEPYSWVAMLMCSFIVMIIGVWLFPMLASLNLIALLHTWKTYSSVKRPLQDENSAEGLSHRLNVPIPTLQNLKESIVWAGGTSIGIATILFAFFIFPIQVNVLSLLLAICVLLPMILNSVVRKYSQAGLEKSMMPVHLNIIMVVVAAISGLEIIAIPIIYLTLSH